MDNKTFLNFFKVPVFSVLTLYPTAEERQAHLLGKRVISSSTSIDGAGVVKEIPGIDYDWCRVEYYDKYGRPQRSNENYNKLFVVPSSKEELELALKTLDGLRAEVDLRLNWINAVGAKEFSEEEFRLEAILVELSDESVTATKAKEILKKYLN